MFSKYLYTIFGFEFADEAWIPKIKVNRRKEQVNRKKTHQSSLAIPKSLQHLINALLFTDSVAVGIPDGSKYSCSPRAMATRLICNENECQCYKHNSRMKKYTPTQTNQCILSTNNLWSYIRLTSRSKTPSSRTESAVENSAIFNFGKVD